MGQAREFGLSESQRLALWGVSGKQPAVHPGRAALQRAGSRMAGEPMYPNILLSVFIALIALQIIGGMVGSPKLVKAASVLMVAAVATALILWLLKGLSPIPNWLAKAVVRLVHEGKRAAHR